MSECFFETSENIELNSLQGHKITSVTMCESEKGQKSFVIKSQVEDEELGSSIQNVTVFITNPNINFKTRFQFKILDENVISMKSIFENQDLLVNLILKSRKIYVLSFLWDKNSKPKAYSPMLRTYEGHLSDITTAYFYSPKILMTTSRDQSSIVWDLGHKANPNFIPQIAAFFDHCRYRGHPSCINQAVLLRTEKALLISDSLGYLKLFNISSIDNFSKEKDEVDTENQVWERRKLDNDELFSPFKFNNILVDMAYENDMIYCLDINGNFYICSPDFMFKKFCVARICKVLNFQGMKILPHNCEDIVSFFSEKRISSLEITRGEGERKFYENTLSKEESFVEFEYEDRRSSIISFTNFNDSTPSITLLDYGKSQNK